MPHNLPEGGILIGKLNIFHHTTNKITNQRKWKVLF